MATQKRRNELHCHARTYPAAGKDAIARYICGHFLCALDDCSCEPGLAAFNHADAILALTPSPSAEPVATDPLDKLVAGFSKALLAKLKLARANGRDGWDRNDWEKQCQQGLLRHLEKGDPRDVAAYCAFMWHHDWITASPVSDARGREALAPFASFGRDESGNDIRDGLMRDRICDWFGPSDFDAARRCFDKTGDGK